MTFVSISKLQAGMILDRDVYLYDDKTSRIAMLRTGGVLTQTYIDRLGEMGILGVYVQSDEDEFAPSSIYTAIKPELKKEAISGIHSTYKMFNQNTARNIHVNSINQTIDVARKLVDTLISDSRISLNVTDLKIYDDYTYNHSLGVTILSIAIGLSLAFTRSELYDLALCGLLHDIGKMAVPKEILSKPARLTTEEYEIMKRHPLRGAQFLLNHDLTNKKVCGGVLTHHERFDGTGYPTGLAGENIPLFGRIISVADVYDALTSARPYREPSTAPEALEYIMGGSGKIFDIRVVSAFLKRVSPYPVGSCVKLSNGKTAIVVQQNEFNPLRPIVRLFDQPQVPLDLYYQRELQNVVISNMCKVTTEPIV